MVARSLSDYHDWQYLRALVWGCRLLRSLLTCERRLVPLTE